MVFFLFQTNKTNKLYILLGYKRNVLLKSWKSEKHLHSFFVFSPQTNTKQKQRQKQKQTQKQKTKQNKTKQNKTKPEHHMAIYTEQFCWKVKNLTLFGSANWLQHQGWAWGAFPIGSSAPPPATCPHSEGKNCQTQPKKKKKSGAATGFASA